MKYLGPWRGAIVWIALAKVASGIALYIVALLVAPATLTPRALLMGAHVVAFGGAAGLLLAGAQRDSRAALLGGVVMLTAAVFADNAPRAVLQEWTVPHFAVSMLYGLQVDAFSAWLLWLFVAEFPRIAAIGSLATLPQRLARVSFWVGVVLLVVNLVHPVFVSSSVFPTLTNVWSPLVRSEERAAWAYWLAQYALVLPALPALIWKARAATVTERRRVSLLLTGMIVGSGPTLIWIVLSILWPGFSSRVVPLRVAGWVIYPTLLAQPFIIAYAVLVRQALDTRLIVRRALQYAFARYTIATLAVVPMLFLLASLYRQRNQSVAQIVSGTNSAVLLVLVGVAVVTWRGRRHLIDRLDRRYFREQYDSREILRALVEQCRRARNRSELAESLRVEIDRALHLESLRVLYFDADRRRFTSTANDVRPLRASTPFLAWLGATDGAVDVDLEKPSHSVNSISENDRYWLADAGARLVLPLKDAERRIVGFVSLGDKRSELPFSSEDRLLLSTVAAAASLSLAFLSVNPDDPPHPTREGEAAQTQHASECFRCRAILRAGTAPCERCGGPTAPSIVPRILAGKFRFLERIGEGGMGVVYRGLDLSLDRVIAIKTLPSVSPDQAVRLRREARAMAAVSHPNLAMIFGSETWNGLPMLIVEYLAGGTLAARLLKGPMPVHDVVDLGATLADVTDALHRAGVLHRDIKPSNIGFTGDGKPKLLDFGMARLLESAVSLGERQGLSTFSGKGGVATELASDHSTDGRIAGTLPYLSPEAVAGNPPNPSLDVWSICIVLFEAIAGRNPAQGDNPHQTLQRISACAFPDLRTFQPEVESPVANFFLRALSQDESQRPRSAAALRAQLVELRAYLSGELETVPPNAS